MRQGRKSTKQKVQNRGILWLIQKIHSNRRTHIGTSMNSIMNDSINSNQTYTDLLETGKGVKQKVQQFFFVDFF